MSRRIYPYNGQPPTPGEAKKVKTANGSRGRMRLRIRKRVRVVNQILDEGME